MHFFFTLLSSSACEHVANQLVCAATEGDRRERCELDELKEQVKVTIFDKMHFYWK